LVEAGAGGAGFNNGESLFNPQGQAAITDEFGTGFNQFDPDLMFPALYAIDLIEGNVEEGGDLLADLVDGELFRADESGCD
jgi:hypothetical protein